MSGAKVLFFNINGSGLGHMTRCLAYARRLDKNVKPFFFSLASAIEIIEKMGFEAEYFVSHYWSANTTFSWNSELAVRFGMVLERIRPDVVVFDGTWPFQGFFNACKQFGASALIWSNRGLLKKDTPSVSVDINKFDLVITPGEVNIASNHTGFVKSGRKLTVPPVCLLDDDEMLSRTDARRELGLSDQGQFVLFSLGPGNIKDVAGIGQSLIRLIRHEGMQVVWAKSPISKNEVELPAGLHSIVEYPLVRCMAAFDAFVGAAGYNTCCEVIQAQIPTLLVPNLELADDQAKRAQMISAIAPVVVSECENENELLVAVKNLLELMKSGRRENIATFSMNGAAIAADAISSLALRGERRA